MFACAIISRKAVHEAVVALVLLAVLALQPTLPSEATILSESSRNFNGYSFVFRNYLWQGEEGTVFQVKRGKSVLEERRDHKFWIFSLDKQADSFELSDHDPVIVADLTGDGVKDVIVQGWSGGVHGDYSYAIYSVGAQLRKIWSLDAGSGHLQVKLNPPRLIVEDSTFCNWKDYSYAESPKPQVTLRWRNGRFRVQFDKGNLCAALDSEDTKEHAARKKFIALIYQGRADQALQMVPLIPDGKHFVSQFWDQFRRSPFYYEIVRGNPAKYVLQLEHIARTSKL